MPYPKKRYTRGAPGCPGPVRAGGRQDVFTRKRSALLYLLPGLIGLTLFYIVPFIGGIY